MIRRKARSTSDDTIMVQPYRRCKAKQRKSDEARVLGIFLRISMEIEFIAKLGLDHRWYPDFCMGKKAWKSQEVYLYS